MKTSLSALLAGALALGVMTVANANEPVNLSGVQLDQVTAGGLYTCSCQPGSILELTGTEVHNLQDHGSVVTHINFPNGKKK
jgi:hypothetical protein